MPQKHIAFISTGHIITGPTGFIYSNHHSQKAQRNTLLRWLISGMAASLATGSNSNLHDAMLINLPDLFAMATGQTRWTIVWWFMSWYADYLMTPYQIMLYSAECELETSEDTVLFYFQVLSHKSLRKAQKNYADGSVGWHLLSKWDTSLLVRNVKCAVGTWNV